MANIESGEGKGVRNLKISLVIATYNRGNDIPILLQHLTSQTLNPSSFEVIVVDDGSTDNTEEVICSLNGNLPYTLRYLRHTNHGVGYTQNRGIREAQAPIVCLIADDIHLMPEALEAHLKDHEQNSEPNVAILGKVIQSPELATKSVFLKKWDPFKFRELEKLRELPYYLFWACNISFKKDFLLKNGLFNETLVGYTHEDVEIGYRLSKKGLKIFYNKNALGHHYHVVTLDSIMQTAYKKGINWVKFRRLVDEPDITVRYHVLDYHYLKDYIEAFRKPDNLIGLDSNPLLLTIYQLMRILSFNFLTIPLFWLPIMKGAEKSLLLSRFMHRLLYRCAISYHFHKGVAHGSKKQPK
ncbi:MAG: glycosyltransferase family 2 protein [Promethearchaeota archaeon]|jgi:glycosyltransferase involved in cell wall biosynthesis